MPQVLQDPNVAYLALFTGVLFIYLEFVRPGSVVPCVIGSVLAMLSIAALWQYPIRFGAVMLHLAAFLLFYADARFHLAGMAGLAGAASMALGAVYFVDPLTAISIHTDVAIVVALPFAGITVWLLSIAIRARKAKLRLCSVAPAIYSHL